MLYELIYHSTSAENLDDNGTKDILETSRINNAKADITGCLVHHDSEFVQILEGNEDEVKKLYAKIQNDPRHYNVRTISAGNIESRAFDKWTMAFHDLSSKDQVELNKISIEALLEMTQKVHDASVAKSLFKFIAHDMFSGYGNG